MNESTEAATAAAAIPAGTTEAPAMPGRSEVLQYYAKLAMPPDTEATQTPAPDPAGEPGLNASEEALSQPTEQVEAIAEAEPEEERLVTSSPTEDHLGDELSGELTPETQEKINRRIGKEVAKTKAERELREAAEAEAADLKAKLAEKPDARRQGPIPLANIHDQNALATEQARAEEAIEQSELLLRRLNRQPEHVETVMREAGIKLTDEQGLEDFSPDRMRDYLEAARSSAAKTIRTAIPERGRFLVEAERSAVQACDFMPELKDPKSPRAKLFREVIRDVPGLQNRADWPMKAMAGVLAMEQLEKMVAAKTKPAAPARKRELPVTIPSPRTQAPMPGTTRNGKAGPVDANAMADDMLAGRRASRLEYIKSFVPKS